MIERLNAQINQLILDKEYPFHPRFRIEKKELLDIAFSNYKIRSIAELGCVWGIDCSYGIYALEKFKLQNVKMVDTHWTETALDRVSKYPEIEVFKGDFSDSGMVKNIGQIDAVLLFDVLLHQVAPDWTRVLEMYAQYTDYFIIFNQDWIKSNITTRLLDLGREEYFTNVPHNPNEPPYNTLFDHLYEKHPIHNKIWRDVHHVWQWGIVSDDLISLMKKLGFRLEYFFNHGELSYLTSFEEHSYIFKKIK
ncbi:hypothetical protein [Sulfuricurvum sp.]|uniref:hypothetical protein n=1 Tax=Sulfuricurvum sp. TaxID=2025608 RepID=UPI0026149A4F|nr:hypothetical protein [Sulfuricurvum sp.]MDD4883100.1 hypothetical protein [Sulfuricurvum sp.]